MGDWYGLETVVCHNCECVWETDETKGVRRDKNGDYADIKAVIDYNNVYAVDTFAICPCCAGLNKTDTQYMPSEVSKLVKSISWMNKWEYEPKKFTGFDVIIDESDIKRIYFNK